MPNKAVKPFACSSLGRSALHGCAVVPLFILLEEFVLPYQGGGASMWPIAVVFGGAYGAAASGAGVLVGEFVFRGESRNA